MVVIRWLLSLFSPLLRYIASPSDTTDETMRKNLFVPVACFGLVHALVYFPVTLARGPYSVAANAVNGCICVVILAYNIVTKRFPQHVAGILAVVYGTNFILGDIMVFGNIDYYTGGVLIMDILLLCNCHPIFTKYILCLTVLVIVVSWEEQVFRAFGIYNAISEDWAGYKRTELKDERAAANMLLVRLAVFVLDYLMTRYFSMGLREQREQVERSVAVAQQIASALARFDLEKAQQEMLESSEGLPVELLEAFTNLLHNLRSYKPYLPQSCLPDEVEGEESGDDVEESTSSLQLHKSIASVGSSVSCVSTVLFGSQKITLVQLNICNFMKVVQERGVSEVAKYHATFLGGVLVAVKGCKGLVEHFHADRVLISFNAAKPCSTHRMHALTCTNSLKAVDERTSVSLAIASGEVLSGPLGCEGLRSYSLIGEAAAWVPLLERFALRMSVTAITDTSVYDSTRDMCHFRLLGMAQFKKRGGGRRFELFEFLGVRSLAANEWMYQLAEADPWQMYNDVQRFLANGDVSKAVELAKMLPGEEDARFADALREAVNATSRRGPTKQIWVIEDVGVRVEREPKTNVS